MKHLAICTPADRGWITPGSEAHRNCISPSKVAAILGLSRWESPFGLWHRMKGLRPDEKPKDAYDLGHDIEPLAANRWRRKNPGWRLSQTEVQFVVDPEHFGFPALATLDRRASCGSSRRVVEFKVARDQGDLDKWGDDLSGDLPPDYWTQVLVSMLFTGWTSQPGHLLAMGPRYEDRLYEVPYNAEAREEAAFIIEECRRFWLSLEDDEPPELDDTVATYECLKELHPDIDGTTVQLDIDEARRYAAARVDFSRAEDAMQFEKNLLLKRMERAQWAEFGGVQIARRQRNKTGVSFVPSKTITPEKVSELAGEGND